MKIWGNLVICICSYNKGFFHLKLLLLIVLSSERYCINEAVQVLAESKSKSMGDPRTPKLYFIATFFFGNKWCDLQDERRPFPNEGFSQNLITGWAKGNDSTLPGFVWNGLKENWKGRRGKIYLVSAKGGLTRDWARANVESVQRDRVGRGTLGHVLLSNFAISRR